MFAGVARATQAQGFRAQTWDTVFDEQRLNLCRSAVRSRLKYDIMLGMGFGCLSHTANWSDFNASPASCTVFVFFQCKIHKPEHHLCSLVHSSRGERPPVKLSCSLSATRMCILICASLGTKMRRPVSRKTLPQLPRFRFGLLSSWNSSPMSSRALLGAHIDGRAACHVFVQSSHPFNPPMRTSHLGRFGLLKHRCFDCSPLATTCQGLRQNMSLLGKRCQSVLFMTHAICLDENCHPHYHLGGPFACFFDARKGRKD